MSTTDFLIKHAQDHVWCTPGQDRQARIRPAKISPKNGAKGRCRVVWSTVTLPTSTHWYHVYQIGEITPKLLGLDDRFNGWISIADQINAKHLIANVYTTTGVQFPRAHCYLHRTLDGNLLLAVRETPEVADLAVEPVYLRVYTNAYFNSNRRQSGEGTATHTATIVSNAVLSQTQDLFHQWQTRKGYAWALCNGCLIYDVNPLTVQVGDIVELMWDSSVKEVREYVLSDLPSFLSTKDAKQKYLLHDTAGLGDTIDYRDDIDVWVVGYSNATMYRGVHYHANRDDAVRMVTHREYSIPVQYVQNYLNDHSWFAGRDIRIRLVIRESGWYRPLVDEACRIKELYKLDPMARLQAMVGTEAVVPVWTAAALEDSGYVALMSLSATDFTIDAVMSAYGYNAVAKLLANAPLPVTRPDRLVALPYGLIQHATVFEYDEDGVLLGYHRHHSGRYYVTRDPNTAWIEGIVGKGQTRLNTVYGQLESPVEPQYNYAYYKCPIVGNQPTGQWETAIEGVDYELEPNRVVWLLDRTQWYTAVKRDDTFMCRQLELDYRDGILRFTVNVDEVRTDGLLYQDRAEIPFGQFDLFLNGRALVQDLDYRIRWPEILVLNKTFLNLVGAQQLVMRGFGFCRPDMQPERPSEYGWVTHGKLSNDTRYQLRDDKIIRTFIDGRLVDRSELVFAEDGGVGILGIPNGKPYQVFDGLVPLRLASVVHDQFDYRAQAQSVDDAIETYFTRKLPQVPESTPNPIPELYPIYSPWTNKLIYDLLNGVIRTSEIEGQYSQVWLASRLERYQWLIPYDPCFLGLTDQYVSIHPHNRFTEIQLTPIQWRFLSRAVQLKLGDRVDLSRFIRIAI